MGYYVTMGSWDGEEVCELLYICLFGQFSDTIDKESIGLYRENKVVCY